MSRLRRKVLSDRFFFTTCRVLRRRRMFEDWDWSSLHDYTGSVSAAARPHRILAIERAL